MVQKQDTRKRLILALSLLGVLLVAIGAVALMKVILPGKEDPYTAPNTTTSEEGDKATETEAPNDTPSTEVETSTSAPDPATVSTIDIQPMEITVSYVKGVGSIEYEVLRTPSGTRYVEFRSAELVGTKCTNDQGTFVSILASPSGDESATLTKTTKIDDTTYGLSLADPACTSNTDTLKEYQQSFSDAFSLLKKMN